MSVIKEIQVNKVRLQLIVLNDRPKQVFGRFLISMVKVSEVSAVIASLAVAACVANAENNKISVLTRKKA